MFTLTSSAKWLLFWGIFWCWLPVQAQLPEAFSDQLVSWGWKEATGFTFDSLSRMYVWEKQGLVYLVEDGLPQETPVLDIREEVANWRDHGLLGLALDPYFLENGYMYLLYVVDRHHLLHAGTSSYDPEASESYAPSIGRITRYTIPDPFAETVTADPGSRKILLGESIDTGIPLMHESHGVGTLLFGTDGTLLASCGDGSSYLSIDNGQGGDFGTYASQARAEGMIGPEEDIGAFRAQSIYSLCGKVLRIDPETGDGVASNPFFRAEAPRAARSRIWALGFRNPFRMTLKPGTGKHSPEEGDPGVLYVGDNGWGSWEELNVVTEGGQNFGWPMYEGIGWLWPFYILKTPNIMAPNPLYDGGVTCDQEFFDFQDLFKQVRGDSIDPFINPCLWEAGLPDTLPRFFHTPPSLDYNNQANPVFRARSVVFDSSGKALAVDLEDPRSQIQGRNFDGTSSIGGAFYTGDAFPAEYRGVYFHGDYGGQWIKAISTGADHQPTEVRDFHDAAGPFVHMQMHPSDGCVYYLRYPEQIRKICYGGNVPPTAVIDQDLTYGKAPLEVHFSAEGSTDPEGEYLNYAWDFGDGSTSQQVNPVHTFDFSGEAPHSYTVSLTVTDPDGAAHTHTRIISLNNTPPKVRINSVKDSGYYITTAPYYLPLSAQVRDDEFPGEALHYAWQTFLHHNTHNHPEPIDTAHTTRTYISPVGCGEETYYYRIALTVTDPAGLSASDEVILLPDCSPLPALKRFQATPHQNQVILSWVEERGIEGGHFKVYRSIDYGLSYSLIDSLPITGAPQTPSPYFLEDASPYHGENRYKMEAFNAFGSHVESEEVSVFFPPHTFARLFPNPMDEDLYLEVVLPSSRLSLTFWNALGEEIARFDWENVEAGVNILRLPDWGPGIYMYELDNGENTQTGRLMRR